MTTAHVELTVDIQVPAQAVWDAIVDWPSQSKWMMGTKVWPVNGDGTGVGGQIEAFTGIWKIGFLDTMTITKWEPPLRCDVDHTGRVVRGTGTFVVVPLSDHSCRFEWSEDLDLPLGVVGKVGFGLTRWAFEFGVQKSLNKFAHMLESGTI